MIPCRLTPEDDQRFRRALALKPGLRRTQAVRAALCAWLDVISTVAHPGPAEPRSRPGSRGGPCRSVVTAGTLSPDDYDRFWHACRRAGLDQSRATQLALLAWIDLVLSP